MVRLKRFQDRSLIRRKILRQVREKWIQVKASEERVLVVPLAEKGTHNLLQNLMIV